MAQRTFFVAAALTACGLGCWSAARAPDGGTDGWPSDDGPDAATADGDAADAGDADTDDGGDGGLTWSEGAPCPLARFEANGAVVGGELWVMGGFSAATLQVTRQVDLYNPATDSWRAGPDLPGAQTHIGVATVGNDVIVVGGFTGDFTTATRPPDTTDVWRWSAADSSWNAGPPLPSAAAAFAFALVGTQLHVAGGLGPDGNTDSHNHFVWDLAGDPASAWVAAALLPDARNHGGGAAVGGSFYAVAGRHSWNEQSGDVPDLNQFDPTTGTWIDRAPIPIARSEIGASTTVLSDGRLLVIGGSLAGVMPSADVLIYDPTQDAWSVLPSLPERRKGAVAAQIGQRIIVTTGSPTSVDPSATTFVGCCL